MRLSAWKDLEFADRAFATVTLDRSRHDPGAPGRVRLRWEAARKGLLAAGAPADLLDLIGDRLSSGDNPEPIGRCIVASTTSSGRQPQVVLDASLPDAPVDGWRFGPLPDLLPLARAVQRHPAHLRVELDRSGADISVRGALEEDLGVHQIAGDHDVIHKVSAGDASEQRLQRRAEDSWEHNAAEVARALESLVSQHDPTVITVAGDTRAVTALRGHVAKDVAARMTVLDTGGRAAGTDRAASDAAIRRALDAVIAGQVEEATSRLLQAEGRQDRAAQAPRDVASAFGRGQVETLLLADPPPDAGRAAEFVADALRTDADVVLVPAEMTLPGGVAALLRWTDEVTPHDSGPSMPGHGEQPGWEP